VRVIAGEAKGTRLGPVPAGTRPVSDRAREGLFSSLGPAVSGARVLDLFAGTGAMGIEALSRGAGHAMFVDSAPEAIKTIHDNLARTGLAERASVRRSTANRAIRGISGQFGLVLLDPPYGTGAGELDRLVDEIAGQGVVAAGGAVVLTRPAKGYTPVIPVHWRLERRLSYGDTVVLVFRVPKA
jgi:16S rRNA (guanine966-N2)-methyltransferase